MSVLLNCAVQLTVFVWFLAAVNLIGFLCVNSAEN